MRFAMRTLALILAALLAAAGEAAAADLTISVRNAAGQPVPNAVVTLHGASIRTGGAIRFPWPLVMAQQNISFHPFVLIAPLGSDVAFPNRDSVRHHVYSFSQAKRFELKLYGQDQTRTVHFDRPGIVALGCNIHDQMSAFIDVVDTPFAALTDANGDAVIRDAPTGVVTMTLWHPYLRAPGNETALALTLPAHGGVRQAMTVELRPPPEMKHHH